MHSFIFVKEESREYGNIGLRLENQPLFDPFEGDGLAHDLLEHRPNDTGSPEDELCALGASLYVRCGSEFYYYKRSYYSDPAYHIKAELYSQLQYMSQRNEPLHFRDCPYRHNKQDEEIEAILDRIVEQGLPEAWREFMHGCDDDYRAMYAEEKQKWFSAEHKKAIKAWFRHGYVEAKRRYSRAGHDEYSMLQYFNHLSKKLDQAIADMELGDRLRVTLNFKKADAVLTRLYEY